MARYDRTVPPGGEGKITLQIDTKGLDGNMSKSARVTTNDPKNAQLTITLAGKIWAPIHLNPRYVNLKGTVGDVIEQAVQLRGEKEEPLTVTFDSVSIPDMVTATLEEVEKGRSYRLIVKNKVEGETTYGGQIKLTTNYPEKPEILIRVSGNVRPALEVNPKLLSFGRLAQDRVEESKKTGKFARRPVNVILHKGDNLEVEKVETTESLFKAVIKEPRKGRTVRILVEPISEKLKKGPNADTLRIYTNQKDAGVLEVPIRIDIF